VASRLTVRAYMTQSIGQAGQTPMRVLVART
jgi:hypothetical protein